MELLLCTSHRATARGTPAEGWVNSIVCLLLSVLLNKEKGIISHFVWHCSLGRQPHNTFCCEILLILCSEHIGSAFGLKWPSAVRLSSSKILVVLLLGDESNDVQDGEEILLLTFVGSGFHHKLKTNSSLKGGLHKRFLAIEEDCLNWHDPGITILRTVCWDIMDNFILCTGGAGFKPLANAVTGLSRVILLLCSRENDKIIIQ